MFYEEFACKIRYFAKLVLFILKEIPGLTYLLDIGKFSNSRFIIQERDDEATPAPIMTPKNFKDKSNNKGD